MKRIPGRKTTSSRAATTAGLAMALVALLAGCVGIPTSGPVQRGEPVLEESGPIFPVVSAGPLPGDSPVDIVRGFLNAQAAGFSDTLQLGVARQFLSDSVRNTWDPLKQAVVYTSTSSPDIQLTRDRTVRVGVVVAGTLDPGGQFSEVSAGTNRDIGFGLEKDAGRQWRISTLDDGLLVSKSDFDTLYRETLIYFPSLDGAYLVPDVRWFSNRSVGTQATQAVRAILGGPSPFLRDSATTVVSVGVKLASEAVTVTPDGIAQVNLSIEEKAATPNKRALLKLQLQAAFAQLPTIKAVQILVGGVELSAPDPPQLSGDALPGTIPWAIAGGRLVRIEGNPPAPVAVPGVNLSTIPEPSDPAIGYQNGGLIVVLSMGQNLVYVPADGTPPRTLFPGHHLVPPSVDRLDWAWTAEAQSRGTIVAARQNGRVMRMKADWLDGRSVRSLRVSRDGSRMVIVSASPVGVAEVDVVAIVRRGGIPQRIGEPLPIGATLTGAVSAAWVDEASVAVLGRAGVHADLGVYLVPIGGPTQLLLARPDAVALAAGRGERALYVANAAGALFVSNTTSWTAFTTGVRFPTFPG